MEDRAVGVDVGYKDSVVLSDGTRLNGTMKEITSYITNNYTKVCAETLNPDWKYLNIMLAKLKEACRVAKIPFVQIDRYYPSTRTCFECKALTGPTSLRVRHWTCCECGEEHDRDINAARNIRAIGLQC